MIRLIVVGKIKERFTADWIAEYEKRLKTFCRIETTQLQESTLNEEATQILRQIKDEFVIALSPQGKQMSSELFAQTLKPLLLGNITFVIGSDKGLDARVLKRANLTLSFGLMTFTHQIARLLLMEQIYRACMILGNRAYHK
ncbi:MAG: 23S rRNA (pseudouridine(1915)-N(3))-methyltransferase RlmH [Candidatus Woesearchaeota archaeon]|nr:23S rRNA (pseudouridine(1915)-N(3))-methyltransferase RlmH [Candidatus Woesearchaeota archaeon]